MDYEYDDIICKICRYPMINSSNMSDGDSVHHYCATEYFLNVARPKSLLTNQKLPNCQLTNNRVGNWAIEQLVKETNCLDNIFTELTDQQIYQYQLFNLINKYDKFKDLLGSERIMN